MHWLLRKLPLADGSELRRLWVWVQERPVLTVLERTVACLRHGHLQHVSVVSELQHQDLWARDHAAADAEASAVCRGAKASATAEVARPAFLTSAATKLPLHASDTAGRTAPTDKHVSLHSDVSCSQPTGA